MKRNISVIIPTYNSWPTLKECVISIEKQTIKPLEIIVIDNKSPDNTSGYIKENFKKIKLTTLSRNTGVTGGRNAGIQQISIKANYLFFFDHDMLADKKMLEKLVEVAEKDKSIGIVTPKIYYWGDKKRIWSAGTGINLWTGQVLFRGGKDIGQYENVEEVQVAPAAMLVKKAVIEKIKGFDNRYFATYEDTDFCFRAKKVGFKTFYVPNAVAFHKISPNPKEEATRLLNRAYWVGRNRVLFMKDFGKNYFIFLLFLPIFCFYYIRLAYKNHRLRDAIKFIYGTGIGLLITK